MNSPRQDALSIALQAFPGAVVSHDKSGTVVVGVPPRHFEAETGAPLASGLGGCVTGFVSWRRLKEVFANAGETRPDEEIASWEVTERGITFWLKD